MIKLALIGKNISHSKSKYVYENILKQEIEYHLIDCASTQEIPSLEELFLKRKFIGVSITAPYKKYYISYLKLSPFAYELGAVNCLRLKDGIYEGTNTDYFALKDILLEQIVSNFLLYNRKLYVSILGDGSMAKITEKCLQLLKIPYQIYSRKMNLEFDHLDLSGIDPKMWRHLIINTCSRDYICKSKFPSSAYYWDYNYGLNKNAQEFASKIAIQVEKYQDGMSLLELQAIYALKYWGITSDNFSW